VPVSGSEVASVVSEPEVDEPEVAFVVPDVDKPEVALVVPDVGVPEVTFAVPDVDEPDCPVSVALCAVLSGAQALSEGPISAIRSASRVAMPGSKQSDNRGIRGCWTPPRRRARSSVNRVSVLSHGGRPAAKQINVLHFAPVEVQGGPS
jgi:hypothetical protein